MEAQVGTGLSKCARNGTITAYSKVFEACKLLEKSEENGQLNK